eukprot:TRINITY_DN3002_c0_g1_i6.p1 TRINITY_DN3002_c0_g1~~TRINITY_DN3002_c0_g1_i6.p1  ORF type:complete len:192 (+),score=58.86 TRINITY_DN3002_c0_g1_i6:111-686(+)
MEKQRVSIIDRPLSKGKGEVSLAAFAFLFCEIVQHTQRRCAQRSYADTEAKLSELGRAVGLRALDPLVYRERGVRREVKLVALLSLIQSTVWKALFGRAADSLEKSIDHEDEYMIIEKHPLVNRFISPTELGMYNPAAFTAGVVQGLLDGSSFHTEKVTAHTVQPEEAGDAIRTVFLIKFTPDVIARENAR